MGSTINSQKTNSSITNISSIELIELLKLGGMHSTTETKGRNMGIPKKSGEALERLIEGNKRFTNGTRSVEPLLAHMKMPDLAAKGQKPFAIVLTCSDSRSPVELIFDQGVGDLFGLVPSLVETLC